jgi:hypothetical protein
VIDLIATSLTPQFQPPLTLEFIPLTRIKDFMRIEINGVSVGRKDISGFPLAGTMGSTRATHFPLNTFFQISPLLIEIAIAAFVGHAS